MSEQRKRLCSDSEWNRVWGCHQVACKSNHCEEESSGYLHGFSVSLHQWLFWQPWETSRSQHQGGSCEARWGTIVVDQRRKALLSRHLWDFAQALAAGPLGSFRKYDVELANTDQWFSSATSWDLCYLEKYIIIQHFLGKGVLLKHCLNSAKSSFLISF